MLSKRDSEVFPALPVERDEVGPKIDYPGLTYAPINEQGVVFLFATMSDDLGFSVEAIRQGYPDAVVIDYRANPNRGIRKNVEFEFRSSQFPKQKSHDPAKCAIIVCWEHDWKNCPKEIEVLELKSLILRLKHEEAEAAKDVQARAIGRDDDSLPIHVESERRRLRSAERFLLRERPLDVGPGRRDLLHVARGDLLQERRAVRDAHARARLRDTRPEVEVEDQQPEKEEYPAATRPEARPTLGRVAARRWGRRSCHRPTLSLK